MISAVIPTYNAASTINKVLEAIYHQKEIAKDEYEVLIIDDCSIDNTREIVKNFPICLITLDKNSGPATARNRGAELAKGEILIFIDSDVILKDDALLRIKKRFVEKSDISALAGIYAKEAANPGFFRSYLALRKYSNWFDPKAEFISFLVVSLGAIKKDVFWEFGGFDSRYRGADVEDFELGYRITEKYKILLAEDVQGYHYFPGFSKTVKNFFKRSSQWMELFFKRKKFSTEAATTRKRAVANLSGFISLALFIFAFFYRPLSLAALAAFFIFLAANMKFYNFVIKEKGSFFLLYSVMLDFIFAAVVGAAALLSILNQCRLRVIHK